MAGAEMLEKHYLGVRGFGAAIASFLALLVVLNRWDDFSEMGLMDQNLWFFGMNYYNLLYTIMIYYDD